MCLQFVTVEHKLLTQSSLLTGVIVESNNIDVSGVECFLAFNDRIVDLKDREKCI